MEISLSEALSPAPGQELWDYFLYGIIAWALITVLVSSVDTNTTVSLFVGYALLAAIFDKTYAFGYFFEPEGTSQAVRIDSHLNTFWTILMRALMFALPLMAAFTTKIGRVRFTAGLLSLIALVYTLGRWFDQESGNLPFLSWIVDTDPQTVWVQGSVSILVAGELAGRWYHRWLGRIHRL
jgi:hypothetical protein